MEIRYSNQKGVRGMEGVSLQILFKFFRVKIINIKILSGVKD